VAQPDGELMAIQHVWHTWPLILAYHSVSPHRSDGLAVKASEFEKQMVWLKSHGYRSVTLGQYATGAFKKGQRIVIITFDDGYADNYTEAFPILRRYGFVGTIFLVADYVNTDQIFPWDEKKVQAPENRRFYRPLTWEEIQVMADIGMEFGSHTCTHPELATLPLEVCREEVVRSRADLSAKLEREVSSFCYPRGSLNDAVMGVVEEAGYSAAVVTPPRPDIPLTPYTLRRSGIYYKDHLWRFRLKTSPLVKRWHYG
jgi:peptidoglycan/xylan/chitin deacetylase (PgdA/CDA1 family)